MDIKEKAGATLPLTVSGEVLHGKRLGREMGFPTANQSIPDGENITFGIYASTVEIDGVCYKAVSNIGIRPTVDGHGVNLESHIFDFSGDIYKKSIKTTLHALLREERCFGSVDELRLQIALDAEKAREYFTEQENK